MINKYVINSLLFNDELWNVRVVGEDDDLDILSLDFMNLKYDKFALISLLKSDSCVLAPTISIDAALLNDDDIVDALREKSNDEVLRIRIVNEDYVLTEEDYNKLGFADYIYVDRVDNFNYNLFKVFKSNGLYKHNYEKVYSDYEEEYKDVFHVTRKLNSTELEKLVKDVNNCINAEIDLNLYDPSYYYSFVKELNDLGLKDYVSINLLSNILVDSKNIFDELKEFKNDINITYSSNHEVINYYCNEPFYNMNNYDNQLEINDHNSLKEYINILNVINGGAEYITDKAYSPLEALVWTYKYIRENDFDTDPSNVFSAILRKSKEDVYRYSSLGENKNILRIKDLKYGVDNIGIVDFNIDIDEYKFNDDYSNYLYFPNLGSEYCNFIYSPRDILKCYGYDEALSISNSLVLDKDTYNKLKYKSCDSIENFYNINYDNRGNTFRFIELIGLKDSDEDNYDIDDLYKYIDVVNDYGFTSNISDDVMFDAIINVEKSINPSIDENEIKRIRDCYDKANEIRDKKIFVKEPHVIANYELMDDGRIIYDEREVRVKPLVIGNKLTDKTEEKGKDMVSVVEDVETLDDYISGTNIKQPRSIREGESIEEYNAYYRDYFNKYLLPVVNSKSNKEEEFIIDNKEDNEAMVVVDDDVYNDSDAEAVVISLDDYNKHVSRGEEIISIPFEKFAEMSDHIVVIPFQNYNLSKNPDAYEYNSKIITKKIFDKFFKKEEEKGIVVSRDVYDKYIKKEEPIVISKRVYLENETPVIVTMDDYKKYSEGKITLSKDDYDRYIDEHTAFIDYEAYDDYLNDSRGIIVSKDIYDMFAANNEEIISIPVQEYLKQNDNVILLSYDTYNSYMKNHGFDENEYRIISDEIFKKYFGNDENLVDAIVVSKEVYESHGNTFKPMKKKSLYGQVDEKYLNIIESIDKEIFKQNKRIN